MEKCLFCKFVKEELPCHKIWDDRHHLAFLTIFPNTDGATVVITKHHYSSYAFDLEDKILIWLVLAAKKIVLGIKRNYFSVAPRSLVSFNNSINFPRMFFLLQAQAENKILALKFGKDRFNRFNGYDEIESIDLCVLYLGEFFPTAFLEAPATKISTWHNNPTLPATSCKLIITTWTAH